jgi:hypothetical protein
MELRLDQIQINTRGPREAVKREDEQNFEAKRGNGEARSHSK